MATLEQLERGLIAADAAGNVEDARAFAAAIRAARAAAAPEPEAPPSPADGMSTTEKVLTGIGGGLSKMRDTLFPPASPVDAMLMRPSDNGRQRRDDLAAYERNKAALGVAGAIGEAIPEVVASAVPISRAGTAISRVPVLAKTLGRLAPAAGDIAANAGYAAATADGDRAGAAFAGGAGAAGGRVLARTLGGMRPLVSRDARTLMDAGVTPTPGQLFGDGAAGQILRATEDKLMSAPFAGDIIRGARTRSLEQYGNAEINAALRPLGVTVRGVGDDAVASAQRLVSDAYDRVLPHVFITPERAVQAVHQAEAAAKQIPLLSVEQEGKIIHYVAQKVRPVVMDAQAKGQPISGQIAKQIDAQIGHYAREFSAAPDPAQRPLGEAFYELQTALREALEGVTPEATKALSATNAAYRSLLPVVKASDRAMAQGGRFTPNQLARASGQYGQQGSNLNEAARRVLPATIPNSGTADRLGIAAAVTSPVKTAVATGIAATLYSRPGMALLINGLRPQLSPKVYAHLHSLAPDEAMKFIEKLAAVQPEIGVSANQLISQMGRQLAMQQQEAP